MSERLDASGMTAPNNNPFQLHQKPTDSESIFPNQSGLKRTSSNNEYKNTSLPIVLFLVFLEPIEITHDDIDHDS